MTAPQADEIELSVFGRGFGECLVAHCGDGQWIIVDSLRDSTREPVALTYLNGLGVPLASVQLLVLTHWHDDHVQGAGKIAQACENATICLPMTLCSDEFKRLLSKHGNVAAGEFTSGVDELVAVYEALKGNKGRRRFAAANGVLFESGGIRVDALSPSHEDIERFLQAIEEWSASGIDRRISKPRRNDTSVALAVKTAEELLLLGGDLEVRGALSGWRAVHELAWGDRGRATLYKIAHHGSETGHYEPIWDDMLSQNPMSVLTPYNRGIKKLPSNEDIERIRERSDNAFSASSMIFRRGSRQSRTVERTLAEAQITMFRLPDDVGHARFRKSPGDPDWRVDLYGSSCRLEDLAA